VTGSTTIAELVMAQRSLIDVQTALAANLADLHRFRAMLETLTGNDTAASSHNVSGAEPKSTASPRAVLAADRS
jgi:hypothetical protein